LIAALLRSTVLIVHTFSGNICLHFQNDVIKTMLSFSHLQLLNCIFQKATPAHCATLLKYLHCPSNYASIIKLVFTPPVICVSYLPQNLLLLMARHQLYDGVVPLPPAPGCPVCTQCCGTGHGSSARVGQVAKKITNQAKHDFPIQMINLRKT